MVVRPKAVVLNDTSTRYHHGCSRVMRLLLRGLDEAGIEVAARSPARADWAKDERFVAALRRAQVVVINGEGTLHDGAPLGARLLSVLDHPAAAGKPVALVNALWERNPPDWDDWLGRLALASARDSASAEAFRRVRGQGRWGPDLSLSAPAEVAAVSRRGLVVGDSVRSESRRALARAAQRLGAAYVPTKTLRGRIWENGVARSLLWRGYNGVWTGRVPEFEMPRDEGAYLARLAQAEGHLTGRFHAVCLSMLTGTPVLALASRTSKIERLLTDAGLGASRLLTPEALERLTAKEAARPFSKGERKAIAGFLTQGRTEAKRLFADIRGLCG
jgi:polysaccharide pyruvyl transferase WcaK-like protein